MALMAEKPDNYYDLAIVDPPYGIGFDGQRESKCKNPKHNRKNHDFKDWDNAIPSQEYFDELFRVSKNQIIWGGNYFVKHLNKGNKGWLIWDKGQYGLTMSDCEIAYSSFDYPARIWKKNRVILSQEGTIHPTQKPVALYRWLLQNYANEGDRILDTHGGSMSIAIACDMEGFELDICELDNDYFNAAIERFKTYKRQLTLF
jgi:site-specific DNA-methyltransferase (adenine-specific)